MGVTFPLSFTVYSVFILICNQAIWMVAPAADSRDLTQVCDAR